MGLSKSGYKYLNWALISVISIVTLFITPVTKSHDPLSNGVWAWADFRLFGAYGSALTENVHGVYKGFL